MTLAEMVAAIQIEVQDDTMDDEVIERAVTKTVSLMSRLLPKRNVSEYRIGGNVTSETLTIASSTGTLVVHPVKVGSVKITGEVEGTDFSVNHLTGVVTEIGSLLADGTYTVSYSRDPRAFDIAAQISDCIKIERVEYPAGQEPPVNPTFEHIGDFLFFKGKDFQLTEAYYLRATYLSAWTVPGVVAGNYPSHLDNAVIIGSSGQYLIFMAEKEVLLAVTSLATVTPPTAPTLSSLTPPTGYTIVKPSSPTLPDAPTAPTPPTPSYTAAEGAMTAIGTEITAAKAHHTTGAALANAATKGDNPAVVYGQYAGTIMEGAGHRVNEAIARLRQIEEALTLYANQVTSYGSAVNAYANNISGLIGKYREDINNEIAGINNVSANVQKYLAEIQEDQNMVTKYQQQVNQYVAQVQNKQIESSQYLNIAGRYLASGQAKIQEFLAMLGIKSEFPTTKLLSEGGA